MSDGVLPLEAVRELSRMPYAAADRSPLGDTPFVLFDADGAASLGTAERERLARWLWQLPCPSLAVATAANGLTRASDVLLADGDDAAACVAQIRSSPIASAVLVQLLRASEKLPVADALAMESMAYATLQAGPEFRRWQASHAPAAPPAPDAGPAVEIQREGGRLTLTLNRPNRRNAMTIEMRDALVEALQLALADESIRALRLGAHGKCFSTGGDLDEFGTAPDPATAHVVRSLAMPGRFLAQVAERLEVHAHVHGACIGSGIEFPAFAQTISAADDSWFQLPELRYGLIPGAGGCVSIARRIGRQRCAYLALSGQRISVGVALDWGLVDRSEP